MTVPLPGRLEESDELLVSGNVIWVPDFDCDFDLRGEGFADVMFDFLDFDADTLDFGLEGISPNSGCFDLDEIMLFPT